MQYVVVPLYTIRRPILPVNIGVSHNKNLFAKVTSLLGYTTHYQLNDKSKTNYQ